MTDLVNADEILIGYNKFLLLRKGMKIANDKYRATENGRTKTNLAHRIWCNN